MAKITILPSNLVLSAVPGENLYQVLREHGFETNAVCGGKGTCGKCKVTLVSGSVKGEKLPDDTYLACKTEIGGDLKIAIPSSRDAAERKSALKEEVSIALNSGIKKMFIKLPRPSLHDQRPDWERLLSVLPQGVNYQPTLEVLEVLPNFLREANFEVTVVVKDKTVIGVEKGDTQAKIYGLAFDIGTTSVVASLLNLSNGNVIATRSTGNPQRVVGADVVSRVEYVKTQVDGSRFLKEKIISALNGLIDQILAATQVSRHHLYEATIVGNSTMQHLLLGINPSNLVTAPYVPVVKSSLLIPVDKLELNLAEGGVVYILPNIAGFVGSDTVGVILATEMYRKSGIRVAIDIGTNGEIAIGSHKQIVVSSTAAGPAFEGAKISCGMRAADGAIEGVKIDADGIKCSVIGNSCPVLGICGSGLIQGVAEMVVNGIVDITGKLISPEEARKKLSLALSERVKVREEQNTFVLVPENHELEQKPIFITQRDIRELQLAKGAIAAGVQILLKEIGGSLEDIEEVLLAGAFGSYIDKISAQRLGLVPQVPLFKIRSVGNAAGVGARMALLSINYRQTAEKIATDAINIELSGRLDFQEAFIENMEFPSHV